MAGLPSSAVCKWGITLPCYCTLRVPHPLHVLMYLCVSLCTAGHVLWIQPGKRKGVSFLHLWPRKNGLPFVWHVTGLLWSWSDQSSLILCLSLSLTHFFFYCLSLSLTLIFSFTVSLSLTHSFFLLLSLSLLHTHFFFYCLSLSLSSSFFFFLLLSLSPPFSLFLAFSLYLHLYICLSLPSLPLVTAIHVNHYCPHCL